MDNRYRPEGKLIATAGNREFLSTASSLERACAMGKILESVAVFCADGERGKELFFDFGVMRGVMPQDEVEYSKTGETTKDIAVITRVGKAVAFKILGFDIRDGERTAVLSRKEAQRECTENYLMTLAPGDIIDASVTHMEPFGAFADIGCGIISLLSIDCISVSRILHPRDRLFIGMPIKAAVKSIDYDNCRIYLTQKELLGTWKENAAAFRAGQTVSGIVRSIESYGIFVELTPNLAGLAEYRDGVGVGDTAAVYIKSIIPEKMKIKLVIIDAFPAPLTREKTLDYKISSGHIDEWLYSPEECERVIRTDFAEE